MGFLRRRDRTRYFTPEPDPDPVLIVQAGGALVDPEWLSEENMRETAKEARRQARLQAERDMAERDAARTRGGRDGCPVLRGAHADRFPEHLRRDFDA